jgi:hypothetical protein
MEIGEEVPNEGQPPAVAGYALSRLNAVQHGLTARSLLLPWENEAELGALLDALVEEHRPAGPTERHLVGEIAAVIWRQRRVKQAEAAAIRDGLREQLEVWRVEKTVNAALAHVRHDAKWGAAEAVQVTEAEQGREFADLDQDERMTRKALRILKRGGQNAYERALAALRQDTRSWWQDILAGEDDDAADEEPAEEAEPWCAEAPSLQRFLESKVLPWYENRRWEFRQRPLLRDQALGAAVAGADLERLGRYETHLDRKLQRLLGLLLRLQEARRTIPGTAA